jgi:hypothetical protein
MISSFAKDFSSVRVNGGIPRRVDSVNFDIETFKDGFSDSFDIIQWLFVESNCLFFGN